MRGNPPKRFPWRVEPLEVEIRNWKFAASCASFEFRISSFVLCLNERGVNVTELVQFRATGRRKTAVARVMLRTGEGQIVVNDRPLNNYFPSEALRAEVRQPLVYTELAEKFDIRVNAGGGGIHGQAGATQHGIARALVLFNPELRARLRQGGFLTRDPRAKERKKYGQKGARKRFQFSKR
jgi:small subunit ribosomal protein S9